MLSETGGAPNLGDEAFFGANSQLSVRKGNSYIAVQPPIMRSPMGQGNPMLGSADRKKIALAIAAVPGTEADSPAPSGGSPGRGIVSTSMTGTSRKLRIG